MQNVDKNIRKRTKATSKKSKYDLEGDMDELDKYEKAKQQKEHKKSKAFVYQDLSRLKIYTLAILFLSASNLLFTLFIMHYYKLQNITTYYFPVAMVSLLLVSIFGQISVIRVE